MEDDALVALDMEDMLHDLGFDQVVVCRGHDAAEAALATRRFAFAVFDLNLDGRLCDALIERAVGHGTHVVVASGYEAAVVRIEVDPAARLLKPVREGQLAHALGMRDIAG